MADEPTEPIKIDRIEPPSRYMRHDIGAEIEHGKARTANAVAVILVIGVVLSLPIYLAAVWRAPTASDRIAAVFDKWYAIVSPLAGTAVGAYYGARQTSGPRGGRK